MRIPSAARLRHSSLTFSSNPSKSTRRDSRPQRLRPSVSSDTGKAIAVSTVVADTYSPYFRCGRRSGPLVREIAVNARVLVSSE